MGFRSILLEGDSLSIIKKLKSYREDRSILKPISQSIRLLESYLPFCSSYLPFCSKRS
ncbi:hypothetical protein Goshw_001815 [Gossypium schwendimanii]|uniref:RNase H type-1 domain-containing protein n=1 Tax=Gossypium schwendimanii TaxID=34291 RepID=A0A7J9MFH6_GOSSC|nr:hypothetical protein [Gossypium schwendimanii]